MKSVEDTVKNSGPKSDWQVDHIEVEDPTDKETEARLRRRLQNRIAQRNHRQRLRANQRQVNSEAQQEQSVTSGSNAGSPVMETSTDAALAQPIASPNDMNSLPLLATDSPLFPWYQEDPRMTGKANATLLSFTAQNELISLDPVIDPSLFGAQSSLLYCHDIPNLDSWEDQNSTHSLSIRQPSRTSTGDLETVGNNNHICQSSVAASNCAFGRSSMLSFTSDRDFRDDSPTSTCLPRIARRVTGSSIGMKRSPLAGPSSCVRSQSLYMQSDGDATERYVDDQSSLYQPIGKTPLHLAAEYGHHDLICSLLSSGAKINALDRGGLSALHHAARNGHLEVVLVLMENGADQDARDIHGWTALHMAAQHGWVDVVETLIKGGVNVNTRTRDS